MHRWMLLTIILCWRCFAWGQNPPGMIVRVVTVQQTPLSQASVELLKQDTSLLKIAVTDSTGFVQFSGPVAANSLLRISMVGYLTQLLAIESYNTLQTVTLRTTSSVLTTVRVSARRPVIEFKPDKTVVNLDAGIASSSSTVLEALEKLPGLTVDRQRGISLNGRSGVLVLLDSKPTYLPTAELMNLLGSMQASQLSQVEIIDHPSARYDAAGSAGIIDLKIKKSRQQGFNGSVNTMIGQGHYFKYSNGLLLNYHNGDVNLFLNASRTSNGDFSDAHALRTYFKNDGSVANLLEQTIFLSGKNIPLNLRTGVDYALDQNTSLGLTITGVATTRSNTGDNPAVWMQPNQKVDSVIQTTSNSRTDWK
ncbi:MAG TPA: TonB-dependent receptor, partial [Flavisolibacter sp.]|nr:TonB-dependent receptor [Flavisolibacter sp.]